MSEAIFKGASGKLYRFFTLLPGAAPLPEPALYAFARPGPAGRGWTPLFLSRTANLAARLEDHERWEEARLLGATHVLAFFHPDRAAREAAEADLTESLRPILNHPTSQEERATRAGAEIAPFPRAGAWAAEQARRRA